MAIQHLRLHSKKPGDVSLIPDCYKSYNFIAAFNWFLPKLHKVNAFLENLSVSLSITSVCLSPKLM
jgi:hypothetical protein